MLYQIREVDGDDEEIAEVLDTLDRACFKVPSDAPPIDPGEGRWWIAHYVPKYEGEVYHPVAYAGLKTSQQQSDEIYFNRAGVLLEHRGQGLQRKLLQVREAWARRHGWKAVRSDVSGNDRHYSANNLIKQGFLLYTPRVLYGYKDTLYFRKELN